MHTDDFFEPPAAKTWNPPSPLPLPSPLPYGDSGARQSSGEPKYHHNDSDRESCASVNSNTSKASQRSWERQDLFDQVLQVIAQDLSAHIDMLKGPSSLTSLLARVSSKSRARMRIQSHMVQELSDLLATAKESIGMRSGKRVDRAVRGKA